MVGLRRRRVGRHGGRTDRLRFGDLCGLRAGGTPTAGERTDHDSRDQRECRDEPQHS